MNNTTTSGPTKLTKNIGSIILNKTTNWTNYIAAVFVFILMLYVSFDVIGRFVFNRPLPGAYELAVSLMAFIVFLGLAHGEQIKIHIRLTDVKMRLTPRWGHGLDVFAYAIGVFLFSLIVYQSWSWAILSWTKKDYMEGQMNFPFFPSKFAAAFGMTFLLIWFILELVKGIIRLTGRSRN
jgi:TRAP-type C4-dicarboxylate transport system permease small subunit